MAFKDEIVINTKQKRNRYEVTIEHTPTRLSVSAKEVKWCKLVSTRNAMLRMLHENVEKQLGRKII